LVSRIRAGGYPFQSRDVAAIEWIRRANANLATPSASAMPDFEWGPIDSMESRDRLAAGAYKPSILLSIAQRDSQ